MKVRSGLVIAILSMSFWNAPEAVSAEPTGSAARPPESWSANQDALKAAPKNHRVLLENAELRVLLVTLQPGEREPLHHHRWPSIMIINALPKMIDYDKAGKEIPLPPMPEKLELPLVLRLPPQPLHSIHDVDTKPFQAIRIEYKKGYPVN